MRNITLPYGEVQLPDSLLELNIAVYNRYQYYMIMASNLGNDLERLRANFAHFFQFMNTGEYEQATQWVHNAYFSLFLNLQDYNPLQYAFALLTLSPEEIRENYALISSEEFLKSRVAHLGQLGLTQERVQEELRFFHPGFATNSD
jgi:hypothetical protein